MDELRARRDRAAADADMVELRLDSVGSPDVESGLAGRTRPAIVTCRSRLEGGSFAGSETERRQVLAAAVASDAEYVDLEWSAGFTDLIAQRAGRGIVLSMHDFDGMPDDLDDRVRAMVATGAEIVKVAVRARHLRDCVRLLEMRRRFAAARMVVIGMGEAGLPTRVLAARFQSAWIYAGDGVAPGQAPVWELKTEFGIDRISEITVVFGVVGAPARHSVSPAMHNAGFAELGIDAAYLPLPTTDLEDFFAFARGMHLAGASVTIPFKVDVLAHLDQVDERARRIGAVNTIALRDGRWVGTNTDGDGFLASLGTEPVAGVRATILGTGGAARAVAAALRSSGATVTLAGRDASRARTVAADLGVVGAGRPIPPGSWDLLVNATPVGMVPAIGDTPFAEGRFDGRLVYDLIYNPSQTRFMREAAEAGCRVIGGLVMLVAQARRQAEWWTGRAPSANVLRQAAAWRLETFERNPR